MSDARAERIGRNEALFRLANERIQDVNQAFSTLSDGFSIVCECGGLDCTAQIDISPRVYERVRADSHLFIIRPSHHMPDLDDLVEREQDAYAIVRKRPGLPRQIAEETDPRS